MPGRVQSPRRPRRQATPNEALQQTAGHESFLGLQALRCPAAAELCREAKNMDPVFTLQWPEFVVAHRLQQLLPKKDGYSVLIPLSRQEKGIDLAILKKLGGAHRTITIQIKASRTYPHPPPKRAGTQ